MSILVYLNILRVLNGLRARTQCGAPVVSLRPWGQEESGFWAHDAPTAHHAALDPRAGCRYFTAMRKIVVVAALASMLMMGTVQARAGDLLLDRMLGTWVGEGERVQNVSGHHIRIQTHTAATMQGDKLFSHNEITETDQSAQTKTYVRDYWVRPNSAQAGLYDFGADDKVTSQGHFDGGILEVEQTLGGAGANAFVIRSRTQFDAQGSLYEEHTWYGNRELSQSRIRYHR